MVLLLGEFAGANIGSTGLVCHLMTVLQANAEAIVIALLSNQMQAHVAIGGGDVLHGLAKLLQFRLLHLLGVLIVAAWSPLTQKPIDSNGRFLKHRVQLWKDPVFESLLDLMQ